MKSNEHALELGCWFFPRLFLDGMKTCDSTCLFRVPSCIDLGVVSPATSQVIILVLAPIPWYMAVGGQTHENGSPSYMRSCFGSYLGGLLIQAFRAEL